MEDRRIVIVGFMGCGKTTVAQALAGQLGCEMIDLDSFVTEREGRSVAEIIQQYGESCFREIETLALRDVLQKPDVRVIALGGGTWTIPANRTLIALNDVLCFWLDASFELCWQRITSSGDAVRPLAPDRDTAHRLYESRRASYQLATVRISVDDSDSAETLAERILTQS
jgi:shikimate kinase